MNEGREPGEEVPFYNRVSQDQTQTSKHTGILSTGFFLWQNTTTKANYKRKGLIWGNHRSRNIALDGLATFDWKKKNSSYNVYF